MRRFCSWIHVAPAPACADEADGPDLAAVSSSENCWRSSARVLSATATALSALSCAACAAEACRR
eukprot:3728234-Lingulodinium_polyedra.AAC.1